MQLVVYRYSAIYRGEIETQLDRYFPPIESASPLDGPADGSTAPDAAPAQQLRQLVGRRRPPDRVVGQGQRRPRDAPGVAHGQWHLQDGLLYCRPRRSESWRGLVALMSAHCCSLVNVERLLVAALAIASVTRIPLAVYGETVLCSRGRRKSNYPI